MKTPTWQVRLDGTHVKVGDKVVVKYLYDDPTKEPIPPASRVFVGATYYGHAAIDGGTESLAVPASTQPGDVIMVAIRGNSFTGPATTTDRRLEFRGVSGLNVIEYGHADGTNDSVNFSVGPNAGMEFLLAVYRFTGTVSFETGSPPAMPPSAVAATVGVISYWPGNDISGAWSRDSGNNLGGDVHAYSAAAGVGASIDDPDFGGSWFGIIAHAGTVGA